MDRWNFYRLFFLIFYLNIYWYDLAENIDKVTLKNKKDSYELPKGLKRILGPIATGIGALIGVLIIRAIKQVIFN